ncbi:MAG: Veg family protein [Christensenellales bacterium]
MNDDLSEIRSELSKNVGRKVAFQTGRGRRKSFVNEGILEDTYDGVFTIIVQQDTHTQRLCYTYGDILTKNIEMKIV